MSNYRQNMIQTAAAVIAGTRPGNKPAAEIALSIASFCPTRDLILDETTSDEQLNAEIVQAIKRAAEQK